ncbi:unnamed protein product [Lepidochelys kempii]
MKIALDPKKSPVPETKAHLVIRISTAEGQESRPSILVRNVGVIPGLAGFWCHSLSLLDRPLTNHLHHRGRVGGSRLWNCAVPATLELASSMTWQILWLIRTLGLALVWGQ